MRDQVASDGAWYTQELEIESVRHSAKYNPER